METRPGLSFRVDRAVKDKLVALAAADKRPLAQYVALVLAEHVDTTPLLAHSPPAQSASPARSRPAPAAKRR